MTRKDSPASRLTELNSRLIRFVHVKDKLSKNCGGTTATRPSAFSFKTNLRENLGGFLVDKGAKMAHTLIVEIYDGWDTLWVGSGKPIFQVQVLAQTGDIATDQGILHVEMSHEDSFILRIQGIWFMEPETIVLDALYGMGQKALPDGRIFTIWNKYSDEELALDKNYKERLKLARDRREIRLGWLPPGRNAI